MDKLTPFEIFKLIFEERAGEIRRTSTCDLLGYWGHLYVFPSIFSCDKFIYFAKVYKIGNKIPEFTIRRIHPVVTVSRGNR